MIESHYKEACEQYDNAYSYLDFFQPHHTWRHVRDVMFPGDVNKAREFYHQQPIVKQKDALRDKIKSEEDRSFILWLEIDDYYGVSREQFAEDYAIRCITPYAIVMDGKWYAKGEMGWFGCSDDKVSQSDWNKNVREMINKLPDDTMITMVDCHI